MSRNSVPNSGSFYKLCEELLSAAFPDGNPEWIASESMSVVHEVRNAIGTPPPLAATSDGSGGGRGGHSRVSKPTTTRSGWRAGWGPFAPGSFLAGLPANVLDDLLGRGRQRTFAPGERLLREGGSDTHMFLLLRGFVKITAVVDGVEVLLAIGVPGDFLGEIAAVGGRPRIATVTACGRVLTVVRTQASIKGFLRDNPDAAVMMTASVGERLHWANLRRAEFFTYSVEVHLARVLLALSRTCGRSTSAGVLIDVQLTQAELASMIGAGEGSMQKAIRSLRERGLILTGYRQITIVDITGLRKVGEDEFDH